MNSTSEYIVACNGHRVKPKDDGKHYLTLEYRGNNHDKNVIISLNNFTSKVYHLSNRLKDLLEIAGYIFAADRKTYRGKPGDIEYHSWSRKFKFHFRVRDYDFWNKSEIKDLLNQALSFMTGDQSYEFSFHKGGTYLPSNLFDDENFKVEQKDDVKITLFSGGLDSLAGILQALEETEKKVCLISHQSGQTGVMGTQNRLFAVLDRLYPRRCSHYKFHCGLTKIKPIDESQRTRAFVFTSTAFAIASAYNKNNIDVYENGMTSINFPETQDLMNARASRTTHPQTIGLLEKLFSAISGKPFKINHPFLYKTKADVVSIIKKYGRENLIDTSVSCSTSRGKKGTTHCGICSQCIDRRFAVFASETEQHDHNGIYNFNFLTEPLEDEYTVKALNDYIRLAQSFSDSNIAKFYVDRGNEIAAMVEYLEGTDEEKIRRIFDLCIKHSVQIEKAIKRMRDNYDSVFKPLHPKSFFSLILGKREYQKENEKSSNNEEEMQIKQVPSRALKKTVQEYTQALIIEGLINAGMKETKLEKEITAVLIPRLEQEYELTDANKRSIHQYFRKGDLIITNKNGKIIVLDTYPGKNN